MTPTGCIYSRQQVYWESEIRIINLGTSGIKGIGKEMIKFKTQRQEYETEISGFNSGDS